MEPPNGYVNKPFAQSRLVGNFGKRKTGFGALSSGTGLTPLIRRQRIIQRAAHERQFGDELELKIHEVLHVFP